MKSLSHVQLFATPWTCSPPGSSIHGILQARILEWIAISFSRGSPWPRDWTQASRIASRCFNLWATREVPLLIISSVQFSCSVMSNSLQPHESQHARPPSPSPTPGVYSKSCLLSRWCHPAISSSVAPNPSQHQGLLQWVNSSHEVAKVLEFQLQHQSFQWTPRTDL